MSITEQMRKAAVDYWLSLKTGQLIPIGEINGILYAAEEQRPKSWTLEEIEAAFRETLPFSHKVNWPEMKNRLTSQPPSITVNDTVYFKTDPDNPDCLTQVPPPKSVRDMNASEYQAHLDQLEGHPVAEPLYEAQPAESPTVICCSFCSWKSDEGLLWPQKARAHGEHMALYHPQLPVCTVGGTQPAESQSPKKEAWRCSHCQKRVDSQHVHSWAYFYEYGKDVCLVKDCRVERDAVGAIKPAESQPEVCGYNMHPSSSGAVLCNRTKGHSGDHYFMGTYSVPLEPSIILSEHERLLAEAEAKVKDAIDYCVESWSMPNVREDHKANAYKVFGIKLPQPTPEETLEDKVRKIVDKRLGNIDEQTAAIMAEFDKVIAGLKRGKR